MKTFKNKVALITGAASGMGKYLAINLAKEGADVVICDVNEDGLKETEKIANNMEETMKYRDAAYSKAQREKLHNDFLNFYTCGFFLV